MKVKRMAGAYVSLAATLLSALGAISVGFATWAVSKGDQSTVTGNVVADAYTSIDGLNVSSSSVLTYGRYFFKNGESTYTGDSATITYSIQYTGGSSITLRGFLSFGSGLAIFNSTYITNVTFGGSTATYSFVQNNQSVEISGLSATSISQNLVFTISNKIIAKHGSEMNGGLFYLSLEAD